MNPFFIDDNRHWEDIGDMKKILVNIASKTTMYNAVALEKGKLLVDVFSPKRAEFL